MEQILKSSAISYEERMAFLVGRYATPLAIFLVSLGIVCSSPQSPVKEQSAALLVFGLIFNQVIMKMLKEKRNKGLIRVRLFTNLGINILLIYLLGGYWQPMWLLLALTPLATAIYDTREKTIAASLTVVAILLAIEALRGWHSPLEWGQTAANSAFILLMSLMVNELSAVARTARNR